MTNHMLMQELVRGASINRIRDIAKGTGEGLCSLSDEVVPSPVVEERQPRAGQTPQPDSDAHDDVDKLESTVAVLKAEIELISMERDAVMMERDAALVERRQQSEAADLVDDLERVREDLKDTQNELALKEKEISELGDANDVANEMILDLEERLASMEDRNVRREHALVSKHNHELEMIKAKNDEALKQRQSALDSKEDELNVTKNKLTAREEDIAELQAVADATREELLGAKRRCKILEEDQNSNRADASLLPSLASDQREEERQSKEDDRIAELIVAAQSAKDELHDTNRRYRILEEETCILEEEMEGLSDRHVRELASQEDDYASTVQALREELDRMKSRCSVLERDKRRIVQSAQLGEETFRLGDAETNGRGMDDDLAGGTRKKMIEAEKENDPPRQGAADGDLWSASAGDTETGSSETLPSLNRCSSGTTDTSGSDSSDQNGYEVSNKPLTQADLLEAAVNRSASTSRRRSPTGSRSFGYWRKGSSK